MSPENQALASPLKDVEEFGDEVFPSVHQWLIETHAQGRAWAAYDNRRGMGVNKKGR
jgi:hypothetical protein